MENQFRSIDIRLYVSFYRMESFQTCAIQMLKEFRALLHISPIPVNSHRLLQLISLNMYAIACSEIKGKSMTDLIGFRRDFSHDSVLSSPLNYSL